MRNIYGQLCIALIAWFLNVAVTPAAMAATQPFEWTVSSGKKYSDPFNDVDVDVIFNNGADTWRVPMFWRGGNKWSVRFSPPSPGKYNYRVQSTDPSNPDLNGQGGTVTIAPHSGRNALLKHGPPRVSANKRYFEHADGTPFYWLGDTLWSGLSDRLTWAQFKELTADRQKKGFTVMQLVAGLVPPEEECPMDPGCSNEGGPVWDAGFQRINPSYFDHADRRIQHLVDAGIAPAIVGAWYNAMDLVGEEKLKKHWRYIVARYGAYPVFWIVGGEILDRPGEASRWTNVARYLRSIDPYHRLITAHEVTPDLLPLHDESLTDFHLFQPGHFGWSTVAVEVAQLNLHYSRTAVTKPLVVGEIGYETIGKTHLEDFQRVAFWLAMLNGAAGFTYGAAPTFEAYTADKPFHRTRWSFLDWREGMNLPGSSQVGLGAKLLREYEWWRFAPRPDWISPRGTTLLEPIHLDDTNNFHANLKAEWGDWKGTGEPVPDGEWKRRKGNFRLPYAAGVPGKVRFVYLPYFDLIAPLPPTIFNLEAGVVYRAYYWETSLGMKIDLGRVARPPAGAAIFKADIAAGTSGDWARHEAPSAAGAAGEGYVPMGVATANGINSKDLIVTADAVCCSDSTLVLRYRDDNNYVAATYSQARGSIYLREREEGVDGPILGETAVPGDARPFTLTIEVRDDAAIASYASDGKSVVTPIVSLRNVRSGAVGFLSRGISATPFQRFEVRQSPALIEDPEPDRELHDGQGKYRGRLHAPPPHKKMPSKVSFENYGKSKHLLLDAYRPELLPTPGDWLLVLEAE